MPKAQTDIPALCYLRDLLAAAVTEAETLLAFRRRDLNRADAALNRLAAESPSRRRPGASRLHGISPLILTALRQANKSLTKSEVVQAVATRLGGARSLDERRAQEVLIGRALQRLHVRGIVRPIPGGTDGILRWGISVDRSGDGDASDPGSS